MGDPRYFNGDIPFIKISDVTKSDGLHIYDSETKVNSDGAQKSRFLKKGRLILSNSGTVCVPIFLGVDACIHDGFVAFEGLPDSIDQKYLYHFFKYIRPFIIEKHKQGITQVNLNTQIVGDIDFLFPPFNEQRRIVAKIEELFSALDKGIESLKTARSQLKIYRQAVLKHAFEGKLTAQWREDHKDQLESPEQLLACMQESDSCLKIPKSWCFSSVKYLVLQGPSNGRSVKDRTDGFPVLRLTALKAGKIDLKERKLGDWDRDVAEPFIVKAGDFLLSRGNGSKHLVGRGGIVPIHDGEVAFPDTMVRLRVDQNVMSIEFFSLVWESRIIRDQIEKSARTTAGIHKINQSHIENFLLPVPSIPEQKNIVDKLSEQLSVIDSVEEEVTKRLANSETLRQSILKKAFSGQLVPQDPNDEPAAVLLERIRAAKAAQPKGPKKSRRGRATQSER